MSIEQVASELRALEKANGALLPADVVEAARDPDSPLHSHFTWDDSEAAAKQRLHEARSLIRKVQVEVTYRDLPITVCRYVRDPEAEAKQAGYRNIAAIKSDEELARAVLVDEMKRVANAVSRAKRLASVLGVESDIDAIGTLAQSITERVETTGEEGRA